MKNFISFLVGLIFALGLGLGGMTQTQVVKGFLDIFGDWNISLLGVMVGAIGIHAPLYYFIKNRTSPILAAKFHIPKKKEIDKKLLIGSAIFGFGWGWGGICPGPGIVALVNGNIHIIIFIISMIATMFIYKFYFDSFGVYKIKK